MAANRKVGRAEPNWSVSARINKTIKERRIRIRSVALGWAVICAVLVIGGTGVAAAGPADRSGPPGGAENGTRLMKGTALYPRAVKLKHSGTANGRIVASVVSFTGKGQGVGVVFDSSDHGRSFNRVGKVADPKADEGLCCNTLYELPRRVGKMAAGTLLWSASVGQDGGDDRRMTVPLWASTDHGHTWQKLATIATSKNAGGLWEPEFTVSADGRLVLYISDESQSGHSQVLAAATSDDAHTWTKLHNVVAADDPALRPGMPTVRRLPSGTYLMSYEICGPGEACGQRTRASQDGVHWGPAKRLGTRVRSRSGTGFRHAPTLHWYDDGTRRGRLLTVGQILSTADNQDASGNGSTVFSTGGTPKGRWQSAPAPVRISKPYDNYCPNYSSDLVPMPVRENLLELATGYDADGVCTTYFATGRLPR